MKYIKTIKIASILGFGFIIALLWLDEIVDLPHLLFGEVPTPVNYKEAILETLVVLIALSIFIIISTRMEKHIKYLEGLTVICAGCRKVRIKNQWIPIEEWLSLESDITLSHGLCDNCVKNLYD